MDDADAADLTQAHALASAMSRRYASLPAIGRCYSCDEAVGDGRRFCDRNCLDDFERVERARRIGGHDVL